MANLSLGTIRAYNDDGALFSFSHLNRSPAGLARAGRGPVPRSGMEKTQKEFLLRQQLAAIRKELGELGPEGPEDTAYRARRGCRAAREGA